MEALELATKNCTLRTARSSSRQVSPSRTGELAWLHQTGTPVVALAASPRIDHVIVQSEVETWAIRADGEVKWRLAHTDVVGAAELLGGQLILTSIAGATQSIDPATGRALG